MHEKNRAHSTLAARPSPPSRRSSRNQTPIRIYVDGRILIESLLDFAPRYISTLTPPEKTRSLQDIN